MFGVPIEGSTSIYCNNKTVYKNVASQTSVLAKKIHSISFNFCREAVAASIVRIAKEDTKTNVSDLFTKLLDGERLKELCSRCMWTDYQKKERRSYIQIVGVLDIPNRRIDHGA